MTNNDFLFFGQDIPPCVGVSFPIVHGSDIAFFAQNVTEIIVKDRAGSYLGRCGYTFAKNHVKITQDFKLLMSVGTCFYLEIEHGGYYSWSYMMQLIADDGETSVIEYRCNENAFGYPYSESTEKNKMRLPIRLFNAQYPQTDKIYQKKSGARDVLYSKIDKEYELETEYIPEEWHCKLIIALSHDQVWIDGELLTKTADYKIEWENYIKSECGLKLEKGNTKMSTNISLRNSNCI